MKYKQIMKSRSSKTQPERKSRAETYCCLGCSRLQLFWPRIVVRKLLNINNKEPDFSADTESDDGSDTNFDSASDTEESPVHKRESRFKVDKEEDSLVDPTNDALPILRRRKSETLRKQYIHTKELRICVGTWNVGGKLPPDDLDIDDWIDTNEPADIYVFGLQEIVPLNAGNIFGAEDGRPVPKWENIFRDTLNRIRPTRSKVKCYSDPSSPSKFMASGDMPDIEEDILFESDSDIGEEIYPLDEELNCLDEVVEEPVPVDNSCKLGIPVEKDFQRQFSSGKRLDRLNCLRTEDSAGDVEAPAGQNNGKLTRMLSSTERIGLTWPEPPLNLLSQHVLQRQASLQAMKSFKQMKSFKAMNSFKTSKIFGASNSFKSVTDDMQSGLASLAELDLEALMKRKRKSSYVRIISKQMVGVFLSIWVRRSLRKHIQNLKVSTVGVGVMGYIGNKGAVSVSMSIYQTPFCFICSHLTSGEKEGDELKRNCNVQEIHRRTQFHTLSGIGLPKGILDHERIIWLGDLNYRINLWYEKTCELISLKQWSKLAERDQLVRELRKGRAFDGWTEGVLNFPPTYKYEMNSNKYYGSDPKVGRRVPAWCDRILSYGKGMKLLKYRRTELKLSDHRPVTATYMAEAEVFSPRKLQRALTYTDAEIENEEVVEASVDVGMSHLRLDQDFYSWER
ncbi:type IV inositol polyphosphate 5-phosphatase 3 isoform X2 [Mercurialis annua]|uniref:type IV inositol polyphosphate 5-phosphatase 3 isoform X2 n=1 Tax=Mercurialis annua TaxID=3986 RepID=UPI00215E1131|nr:type IV inositol polyphosphate 5-phosphatase 3 isoform X2 [Mercurialis annua]